MFRLSREVRFAINLPTTSFPRAEPEAGAPAGQDDGSGEGSIDGNDAPGAGRSANGHAGVPALSGLGHYFALQVTLAGPLDPSSQYLRNIKEIDQAVRRRAVPLMARWLRAGPPPGARPLPLALYDALRDAWPGADLHALTLALSPFLSVSLLAPELPMTRLSQKFEFSASHRLHNPALSADANRRTYGKCNNPRGHGHNYEVQVTLAGEPAADGVLVDVPAFERAVGEAVIDRFDHKHLNEECPEFAGVIPSVENIARVIYRLLKPRVGDLAGRAGRATRLASVTVWETPKTWCEYSEEEEGGPR